MSRDNNDYVEVDRNDDDEDDDDDDDYDDDDKVVKNAWQ